MAICIKNTLAYLGEALIPERCDIWINETGQIENITKPGEQTTDDAVQIDGSPYVAIPALTDLHVHFREPGFEHKETLLTGSQAAIKGGVTTVCTMPNTMPAMDRSERLTTYLKAIEKLNGIDIRPSVAVTVNQAGEQLTALRTLSEEGAVAFTDDGRTVMSTDILAEALKISELTKNPVMTHSEDHQAAKHYLDGPYPPEVESDIVARDIALLKALNQGHLHIAHLSTEGALEAVKNGKQEGLKVTCEVSPHHLYFNADNLSFENAYYKVNPPLRGEANRQKLIEGVKAGIIDAIASDHAPHEIESKYAPYAKGTYGFTGLETLFAASHTVLSEAGLSLSRLIELMCFNPRRILGLKPNVIAKDREANFILVDLKKEWTVQAEAFASKSPNSPWIGHTLKGQITHLIYKNRILLEEGELKWPSRD